MSRWIRRFHPSARARARLVCLPHAGGSATAYFPFSRAATEAGLEAEVVAIQYPGRQDRRGERCLDDVGAMADAIAEDLRQWSDLPLVLFGHSMGATVGYEVARRMQAQGRPPAGLFASACRAPSAHRIEYVHQRDDEGLIAALKELSGTDAGVFGNEELLRMVLPAIRGDYTAVETYRHRTGVEPACPLQVLTGDADPVTTLAEADAWRRHTTGECAVEVFPGGHFYLHHQLPAVLEVVAARLTSWLPENPSV
ncbi:thioesterase II family protein [Amycolatopsis jiangsuensis]|uniref:Surfactin synthase thioesterase subunit n=1 Tax=Amycolatopsis jiangsuensis TaxID=1181879 RepID=A0A840J5X8_9PSEU|nr:alpha/beta fold hydrolase [Amycolatopsis jiangsuensis]MBB4689015.1 surfactin synthase thioesterase subunit [Amycolatopsis jiangsuensis]